MRDILEEIIAHKRIELETYKQLLPVSKLEHLVTPLLDTPTASMRNALEMSETGIIAEFKRKSPSKGWIRREGKAGEIPIAYQQHGAAALSILTDQAYFGGYDEFIQEARLTGVTLPILYKNFVIDAYQLLQARYCGASTVLLIAAALPKDVCDRLLHLAHDLGMEVLLEMHDERDLEYAALGPDLYGINNRHLGSFVTTVETSFLLAEHLPPEACKVSESGISNPQTICQLRSVGYRGFLIGEALMRCEQPGLALEQLVRAVRKGATEKD